MRHYGYQEWGGRHPLSICCRTLLMGQQGAAVSLSIIEGVALWREFVYDVEDTGRGIWLCGMVGGECCGEGLFGGDMSVGLLALVGWGWVVRGGGGGGEIGSIGLSIWGLWWRGGGGWMFCASGSRCRGALSRASFGAWLDYMKYILPWTWLVGQAIGVGERARGT
ncbi:hypothetical protein Tco_1165841 [Tanacetum coccineum]